jgi:VanZ family protein
LISKFAGPTQLIRRVRIAATLLILYWVALFVATHVPVDAIELARNSDKVIHFAAYGGLAFLLALAMRPQRRSGLWTYAALYATVAGYGVIDELIQAFVPGRSADPLDWLADVCGAGFGLVAYWLVRSAVYGFLAAPRTRIVETKEAS